LIRSFTKLPLPNNLKTEKAFQEFEHFIREIISQKREKLEKNNYQIEENAADILDSMLITPDENGQYLSDTELYHNTSIFFVAGQETTASALSFAIHMLAQNPDIQEQVYEEVIQTLGHDRTPEWQDFKNLKVLGNCLKETLRLFPPAPIVTRIVGEDTVLSGYRLQKGTMISVLIRLIQKHPRLWSNPEKFEPSRFDGNYPRDAWMPFSFGPRMCIAVNFAMEEMKVALALIVREFQLIHLPNQKVPFGIEFGDATSISPTKGHLITIKKREK